MHFSIESGDKDSVPDINNLMNTVSLIQNHWYIIGSRLDIPDHVLKEFWTESSQLKLSPKETYCCCKMLLYWQEKGKNVTVEKFLVAVNFPPFCFDGTTNLIKSTLLDNVVYKSHFIKLPNEVNDNEREFAAMIAEVIELLTKCNVDFEKYKHYLDHCKSQQTHKQNIQKNIYQNVTNFSDLVRALRNNGYITITDLSWLKYLVDDVANSSEALSVIQKYEEMSVAQKLHWSDMSKTQTSQKTLLMAKTDINPALLSGKDISNIKSACSYKTSRY